MVRVGAISNALMLLNVLLVLVLSRQINANLAFID